MLLGFTNYTIALLEFLSQYLVYLACIPLVLLLATCYYCYYTGAIEHMEYAKSGGTERNACIILTSFQIIRRGFSSNLY